MLLLAENQSVPSPVWIPLGVAAMGLLGAVANTLANWWNQTNTDVRRSRLWDEATKATGYWEARLKLLEKTETNAESLTVIREETGKEIERIRGWLMYSLKFVGGLETKQPRLTGIRWLLLLYPDANDSTLALFRFSRLLYWCVLAILISTAPSVVMHLYPRGRFIRLTIVMSGLLLGIMAYRYLANSRYREQWEACGAKLVNERLMYQRVKRKRKHEDGSP